MYPGLIDLHNHPKQSLLPLWGHAHGQFANRHEWRDWSVYSLWREYEHGQVMVLLKKSRLSGGLSYKQLFWELLARLQVLYKEFSIGHVEAGDGFYNDKLNDSGDFVAKELNVQTPTDLFLPDEMTFIYRDVRPYKTNKVNFHDALKLTLSELCPGLVKMIIPLAEQENLKVKKLTKKD